MCSARSDTRSAKARSIVSLAPNHFFLGKLVSELQTDKTLNLRASVLEGFWVKLRSGVVGQFELLGFPRQDAMRSGFAKLQLCSSLDHEAPCPH